VERVGTVTWREITGDRVEEFVAKGHRRRHVFPHCLYYLPKCGPDGYRLAVSMCGETRPERMWEIVLYADESLLGEFPRELFFDDDLVWHQQQFGLPGQIATADVVVRGRELWSMAHVADTVQRISRRREHKTRIEKVFAGWHDMLLNGLLAFAVERGVERIHLPTAGLAIENTDPAREKGPELFERLYDRDANRLFRTTRSGDWWTVSVPENAERLVAPAVRRRVVPQRRAVCICHDIERGLGHVGIDADLAELADREWRRRVDRMLGVESELGIRATYNVLGLLLGEVRAEIEGDGHCVGFHSYDHRIGRSLPLPPRLYRFVDGAGGGRLGRLAGGHDQLALCRQLDYRIKGYRPPRSRITAELQDERLLHHNFEWFASSSSSLRTSSPVLQNGIVRIPVHLDDFDLYRERLTFDAWEVEALATIAHHEAAVISLHDCYADLWLPRYRSFLEKAVAVAEPRTLDQVAAETALAAAV
jgi:peptidoglycan/xylan/chitin deacetylase (PgdA/CDA1 family)